MRAEPFVAPPSPFDGPATSSRLARRPTGFAPPLRGGFALVGTPERSSACAKSYALGVVQPIRHLAIFYRPPGHLCPCLSRLCHSQVDSSRAELPRTPYARSSQNASASTRFR